MYPIGNGSHAYGFADIREGTELYPRVRYGDNDSGFVLSSGCRCRALYDPNDGVSFVNFVVPGYGIRKPQLGEGVKFTPESEKTVFPEKRLCGSLALYNSTFETSAVLMELITLVTHGLRSLTLDGYGEEVTTAATPIDLCALSTACPELQHLYTIKFNVVVSAHNESLRRWPIKMIAVRDCTSPLSDLTRCLRNPTLRMARQLVELEVTARKNVLDEEEMRELNANDGEFLHITKEKLPAKSKAAMLSVVTSASCTTKPIRRLDAYILSLIFTFASIPEQRSVKC
ncbi:hypothetical protein PF002_g12190 [Phytophthora fragariae]|uniref:Uncharacterized protein n=1 Tax=Phytophthora fragariae TaxID=53985 RepID=A0A6A3RX94_9STRA|nr:hypothetical protein PF009_g23295 [Phytophthora fragariae]KAE9105660.1 hypothetical protein PF006_g21575 [Phytophthora fragariae]KAE9233071.1 hypothetical protein PF002_g12190 [Phytophthora fragariae]